MSILFTDDFHRADNPTSLGPGWIVPVSGTYGASVFGILNNAPIYDSSGGKYTDPDSSSLAVVPGMPADCTIEATTTGSYDVKNMFNENTEIVFRGLDADHYLKLLGFTQDSVNWYIAIFKWETGSINPIYASDPIPNIEKTQKLTLQLIGSALTVFADDVQKLQIDLSTIPEAAPYLTGTLHGMELAYSGDDSIDRSDLLSNFQIRTNPAYPVTPSRTNVTYRFRVETNPGITPSILEIEYTDPNTGIKTHIPCLGLPEDTFEISFPAPQDPFNYQAFARNIQDLSSYIAVELLIDGVVTASDERRVDSSSRAGIAGNVS